MGTVLNKNIKIVIAIGCLLCAGLIVYFSIQEDSGLGSIERGNLIWLKCRDCGAEYRMDERDYLEKVAQETPVTFATPPIPCQSCGKKGVFEAIKCSKCGHVFFPGNRVKDFPDRCPECKYSEMEEKRKKSTQRN